MPTDESKPDKPRGITHQGVESPFTSPESDILSPAIIKAREDRVIAADRVLAYARELTARLDRQPSSRMIVALWVRGFHEGKKLRVFGRSGETTEEGLAEELRVFHHELPGDHVPVCIVSVRTGVPLDLGSATTPASSEGLAPEEVERFVDALAALHAHLPLRVLFRADPGRLKYFGVVPAPQISPARDMGLWTLEDFAASASDLCDGLGKGNADLVFALTSVFQECDRRWMRDPDAPLRSAAKQLLDEAEKTDLSADSVEGLPRVFRIQAVWEVARTEVKSRLESAIEALSRQTFSTFEEKRDLASTLMQVMDRWGYRAISPTTGNPSILRVRRPREASAGNFQFDEVPGLNEAVPSSRRNSRGGTSQLPAFRLTDRPPDRRRRNS